MKQRPFKNTTDHCLQHIGTHNNVLELIFVSVNFKTVVFGDIYK